MIYIDLNSENEIKSNRFTMKNMHSGEQQLVEFSDLLTKLSKH